MTRLPEINEKDLSACGKKVFQQIKKSRGVVRGPLAALLRLPQLASAVAEVGAYIRYEGKLPAASRELAILACARESGAKWEWFEHEKLALSLGVRPDAIKALARQLSTCQLRQEEQLIISLVQALCRRRKIPDVLYRKAIDRLGADMLVELVVLVGYYNLLALVILGFEITPPPDAPPGFA